MELAILERIMLLNILPVEGDVVTVRLLKKLREELGFTEDEIKTHKIKSGGEKYKDKKTGEEKIVPPNSVNWEETGYKTEISIGEKATDIIKDAFKKLDREKKLREEMLPLYETFMGTDGKAD